LIDRTYERTEPNERGHFKIGPLGVELGIWQGKYLNFDVPWLRFWDARGELLLTGNERWELQRGGVEQERPWAGRSRAEQERQRAEQERQRAEQAAERAERERERADQEHMKAQRLATRLRELGIDPDHVA